MTSMFDCVIVGYGPIGATLAGLLGQSGQKVLVIDKADEIFPLPRALGLDDTAMRLFQSLGVADKLVPHVAPYPRSVYLGAQRQPIQIFDMAPPPYPQWWAPNFSFDQPALERILRSAVEAMPNVSVRLASELSDLRQAEGQVEVDFRQERVVRTVTGRYVVGCDGARSLVRELVGLRIEDLQFDEPWIVIDFNALPSAIARLPRTNVQYCDPKRPATYVIGPGLHRRWEIMALPEDRQFDAMTPDDLWQLLKPWVGKQDGTIRRAASYRFHALVGQEWRDRRVLLAGDAAHQMPPFLGQGMCQGLRDAGNLSWKLQAVLSGADDDLLETYTAERRAHVREITTVVKLLGHIICERNPERAARRDEEMLAKQGGFPEVRIRQSLFPGIREGVIVTGAPGAGTVFPQDMLYEAGGPAVRSDDLMGTWFKIYAIAEALPLDEQERLQDLAPPGLRICVLGEPLECSSGVICVSEKSGLLTKWMIERGVSIVIVRPDHYVYWAGTKAADLQAALEEIPGRGPRNANCIVKGEKACNHN